MKINFKICFFSFFVILLSSGFFFISDARAGSGSGKACKCGDAIIYQDGKVFSSGNVRSDLVSAVTGKLSSGKDCPYFEGGGKTISENINCISNDMGGTYCSYNVTCEAVNLMKTCMCTKSGSEVDNTVAWMCNDYYYSDPSEAGKDFSGQEYHQKTDGECKSYGGGNIKGCCCMTVSEGALNAERKCVVVEATESGANPVCDAIDTFSSYDPFAKVELSSLSKDGTCTEQEKVISGTLKTEDKTVDAGKQLGAEAAAVLNPMKFKTGTAGINDFIGRAISTLTFLMGSLLFMFYIYAGILWMTAAGSSEKTGKAKQIVVWSTLGVVVILASYMIVSFVFKTVG
jgi:hypothetical protein